MSDKVAPKYRTITGAAATTATTTTTTPKKPRKRKPKPTDKFKGKKVLCRIKDTRAQEWGRKDEMVIYRDGTWRNGDDPTLMEWDIAYSAKAGPLFLYREFTKDNSDSWQNDFASDDEFEVKIATTITKALSDLAVEDMLKGTFDEEVKEN